MLLAFVNMYTAKSINRIFRQGIEMHTIIIMLFFSKEGSCQYDGLVNKLIFTAKTQRPQILLSNIQVMFPAQPWQRRLREKWFLQLQQLTLTMFHIQIRLVHWFQQISEYQILIKDKMGIIIRRRILFKVLVT